MNAIKRIVMSFVVSSATVAGALAEVGVPSGYTRAEYIQGDGSTSYVVTDFVPNPQTDKVVFELERTNYSKTMFVFCARKASKDTSWSVNLRTDGTYRFDYFNKEIVSTTPIDGLSTRYTYEVDGNEATRSGGVTVTASPNPSFTQAGSALWLFRAPDNEESVGNFRLYSFKIYRNGDLIHDLVPALDAQNDPVFVDIVGTMSITMHGKFTSALPEVSESFNSGSVVIFGATAKTTVGADKVYEFSRVGENAGRVEVTGRVKADILIVGGGGSGGIPAGGGGGGGGVVYLEDQIIKNGTYNLTVGDGGAKVEVTKTAGNNGGDSSFTVNETTYIARGGGGGGERTGSTTTYGAGKNGGCGGGGSKLTAGSSTQDSYGGAGHGHEGSVSITKSTSNYGGGGGGAGAAAYDKKGGDGFACSITGEEKFYGAGGGGGHFNVDTSPDDNTGGAGGNGGGGNGGTSYGVIVKPEDGSFYGAGGGGANETSVSGAGYKGVVILRFKNLTADDEGEGGEGEGGEGEGGEGEGGEGEGGEGEGGGDSEEPTNLVPSTTESNPVDLLTAAQTDYLYAKTVAERRTIAARGAQATLFCYGSPVTLSWTGTKGACTVCVKRSSDQKTVYEETVNGTSATIYNLELGAEYEWTVVSERSNLSASATFWTSDLPPRLVRAGQMKMLRDLGGWTGLQGCKIRQNLIFRGAAADVPSTGAYLLGGDADRAFFYDVIGLKNEIDFRDVNKSDDFAASSRASGLYKFDPTGEHVTYNNYPTPSFNQLQTSGAFPDAFKQLMNPVELPAYFHCKSGRDRTGSCTAVLLAVLGVSSEDIKRDYQMTSDKDNYVGFGQFLDVSLATYKSGSLSLAENARVYLMNCGLTSAQIETFRETMLIGYVPQKSAMSATVTGWYGVYDGNPHSAKARVSDPASGYTITWDDNSTGANGPSHTDVGVYTNVFTVTADGYLDFCGTGVVTVTETSVERELPFGYTRAEYIQGDGSTSYVVTDFVPNPQTDKVVFELERTNYSKTMFVFCARKASKDTSWSVNLRTDGTYRFDYFDKEIFSTTPIDGLSTRYTYEVDGNEATRSGGVTVTASPNPSFTQAGSALWLFRAPDNKESVGNFKMYSFKIYRNGELIHDLVPALDAQKKPVLVDVVGTMSITMHGTFTSESSEGGEGGGDEPSAVEDALTDEVMAIFNQVNPIVSGRRKFISLAYITDTHKCKRVIGDTDPVNPVTDYWYHDENGNPQLVNPEPSIRLLGKVAASASFDGLIHAGDFSTAIPQKPFDNGDYLNEIRNVKMMVSTHLPNTPFFAVDGNHDRNYWNGASGHSMTDEEWAATLAEINTDVSENTDIVRTAGTGNSYMLDFTRCLASGGKNVRLVMVSVFDTNGGSDSQARMSEGLVFGDGTVRATNTVVGVTAHDYRDAFATAVQAYLGRTENAGAAFFGSITGHRHQAATEQISGMTADHVVVKNAFAPMGDLTRSAYRFAIFVFDTEKNKMVEIRLDGGASNSPQKIDHDIVVAEAHAPTPPTGEVCKLDWIQCNGDASYFDTDFVPDPSRDKIEIVVTLTDLSNNQFLFGARRGNESSVTRAWAVQLRGSTQLRYDYNKVSGTTRDCTLETDVKYTFTAEGNTLTWSHGDGIVSTEADFSPASGPLKILYADNAPSYTSCKLHSFRVWRDARLVHEFLPVKLSSGEVTLLDCGSSPISVTRHGTFQAGPALPPKPKRGLVIFLAVVQKITFTLLRV